MNGNCLAGSGKRDVYLQIKDDDFSVNIAGELALSPKASLSLSALAYPDYKNITAKPNALNPNTQVDVAWDELRIEGIRTALKSFTLDITSSGALGLDTGAEAVSTWYYIWAICNNTASIVSAMLSASATAPTLPSGYTKKRLIGAVYNMADGHFRGFIQKNKNYAFSSITMLSGGSQTTYTEIDISSIIPIDTTIIYGSLQNSAGTTVYIAATIDGHGQLQQETATISPVTPYSLIITNSQKIYYKVSGANCNIHISGFEITL
jgi:hypothetical protein